MALPLPTALTPSEVAFLCEMELITVIPRQKLDKLRLIGGSIPALNPPRRENIPLWLGLLLKKQKRANIVPPPWLQVECLSAILNIETDQEPQAFSPAPNIPTNTRTSPPFIPTSTVDSTSKSLPYHWLELGEILLDAASDDFEDANQVRSLLRDLRETRLAKLRSSVEALRGGAGISMNGVGAMELSEGRQFIGGVIDGLRKLGSSKEQIKLEQDNQMENTYSGTAYGEADNDDELMT